jgi:hypothetical protein
MHYSTVDIRPRRLLGGGIKALVKLMKALVAQEQ